MSLSAITKTILQPYDESQHRCWISNYTYMYFSITSGRTYFVFYHMVQIN